MLNGCGRKLCFGMLTGLMLGLFLIASGARPAQAREADPKAQAELDSLAAKVKNSRSSICPRRPARWPSRPAIR